MDKTPYRVGGGANLALYPRGTKVGDTVHLTDAEALYERDLGRLEPIKGRADKRPHGDRMMIADETDLLPSDGAERDPVEVKSRRGRA